MVVQDIVVPMVPLAIVFFVGMALMFHAMKTEDNILLAIIAISIAYIMTKR